MGWQFKRAENTLSDLLGMKGQREMLRIYVAGMFVLGANSTFQQTYNSLGEGGKAFFFAFYRKIIMLIPLIYVLLTLLPWGVMAVVLVEPAADIAVVGRFTGQGALASVSASGPVSGLIVTLFMGLSVGANVLCAQYAGAGRDGDLSETLHTTVVLYWS